MTRALVIARRLYAAALALWPRSLRERYGHDMRATFDALSADAAARGPRALVALLAAEMIDLTRTMPKAQQHTLPRTDRMTSLLHDIRYAVRLLRRSRASRWWRS
jgi:hypothetical protein